jgi:hypothetical protein
MHMHVELFPPSMAHQTLISSAFPCACLVLLESNFHVYACSVTTTLFFLRCHRFVTVFAVGNSTGSALGFQETVYVTISKLNTRYCRPASQCILIHPKYSSKEINNYIWSRPQLIQLLSLLIMIICLGRDQLRSHWFLRHTKCRSWHRRSEQR